MRETQNSNVGNILLSFDLLVAIFVDFQGVHCYSTASCWGIHAHDIVCVHNIMCIHVCMCRCTCVHAMLRDENHAYIKMELL